MIGLVLYASCPDHMATFYGSLFEMERSDIDGTSFSLVGPEMEFHIVKIPDGLGGALTLSSPSAPRESTPLKFSIEVPSVDQLATTAKTLGGVTRGESWDWHSRRHLDIVDPEGNIFQVFERSLSREKPS
jgi:predicted enzyme related to lactoylglutathione lyase